MQCTGPTTKERRGNLGFSQCNLLTQVTAYPPKQETPVYVLGYIKGELKEPLCKI